MFLRKIMLAIARLIGVQMQSSETPVPQTQSVGPANKELTAKRGNKRSAPASTKPRKSATSKSSSKPKAARPTSVASSRKAEPKPAQTTSGKRGRPRKILA